MEYSYDSIPEEIGASLEYMIEDNSFYYPAGEGIYNNESFVMVLTTEEVVVKIKTSKEEQIPTMVEGSMSDDEGRYSLNWAAELYKVETVDRGLHLKITYYISDVT